jgi:YegS/Rv2252/BmrU family lipid kinase
LGVSAAGDSTGHAFVVLNPVAVNSKRQTERLLQRHFTARGWTSEIYATTGDERIAAVVRAALNRINGRRVSLFVAAGGDGTVSGVAGGVARAEVPMGIIPLGTGNTFARELGVPMGLEPALEVLTGQHEVMAIDAMRVGDRFFVLNVSIGISGLMMRDTKRADKQRFGRVAYVWTGLRKLFGYQPHRFRLTIDGRTHRVRASDVAIVNSGALGDPALRWNPEVELDDGRLDVCVMRARSVVDYLGLATAVVLRRHKEEPGLRHYVVERQVTVDAGSDLPVQGDGDFIGMPPVEVRVAPGAVRVMVPPRGVEEQDDLMARLAPEI